MAMKSNFNLIILAVVVVVLVVMFLPGSEIRDTVEVTTYNCDLDTGECDVLGVAGKDAIPIQSIVRDENGQIVDQATHFSVKVTITGGGIRDITKYRLRTNAESPGTTIDLDPIGSSGVNAFYEMMFNGQATPFVLTDPGNNALEQIWDSKSCEGGTCVAGACASDADCDAASAVEICLDIDPGAPVVNRCIISVLEYATPTTDASYGFQASVDVDYLDINGDTQTVVETSDVYVIDFLHDLISGEIFDASVTRQ